MSRPTNPGLCEAWCAASRAPNAESGPRFACDGRRLCAACTGRWEARQPDRAAHASADGPWSAADLTATADAKARRRRERAVNDAQAEAQVDRLLYRRATTYRTGRHV